MTGTLAVAPPWTVRAWVAVAARALALMLLLAAGGSALYVKAMPEADFQALLHDVRAGKARSVVIIDEGGDGATVRWSTGALRHWTTPSGRASLQIEGDGERTVDVRATIVREARAAGHPIRIDSHSHAAVWTLDTWWPALGWLATAAWLLAFAAMLANRRTRYANRWAWFWLCTQGVVGVVFYLLLEPVPLWCRPGRELRPDWRMRGGVGFLTALLLALLVGLLTIGVDAALDSGVRTSDGELIVPVLTG